MKVEAKSKAEVKTDLKRAVIPYARTPATAPEKRAVPYVQALHHSLKHVLTYIQTGCTLFSLW